MRLAFKAMLSHTIRIFSEWWKCNLPFAERPPYWWSLFYMRKVLQTSYYIKLTCTEICKANYACKQRRGLKNINNTNVINSSLLLSTHLLNLLCLNYVNNYDKIISTKKLERISLLGERKTLTFYSTFWQVNFMNKKGRYNYVDTYSIVTL